MSREVFEGKGVVLESQGASLQTEFADAVTECIACGECHWVLVRDGFDMYHLSSETYHFASCSHCGHVAQVPAPTKETLDAGYADTYPPYRPAWKEPGWPIWKILREITTWRRMRRLRRYGTGKKLLEVGSGAGDFLYAAHRAGWEVSAVEYNRDCAEKLRAETGIDIRSGDLLPGMWEPGTFDLIAMWNVVEHLPDPLGTLRTAAEYLKPGGRAFIQVPTSYGLELGRRFGPYWQIIDLPRHLNLFSRESLTAVCAKVGMDLILFKTSAIDLAWCYAASAGNRARDSRSKLGRLVELGLGAVVVLFGFLPWMTIRAWKGRATEAFAVAVKR